MPKPLVPVAGVPLIESAIANFLAARIGSLVIIVNEQARACVEHVRSRFPTLEVEFIVKTTRSSLDSFFEVAGHPAPGPMLISTVDALCTAEDFARFAAAAARRPPDVVVLGVTPFVADENPVWVNLDGAGLVNALGGGAGPFVTAGFYLLPERLRRMRRPVGLARLRDFLGWLVARGEPVYAEIIERVVDVDRGQDVVLAEALRAERAGTAKR